MKTEEIDLNDIVTNITRALAKMNFNNLLWALLVGVIGYVVVKYIMKAVSKLMKKTPVDPSIRSISLSVIKMVLYFIVATIVADILGLPPTSLVTVLGTMGLAFSLAMQDSLSNIAGGMLLLYTAPFKAGDFIEASGLSGTAEKVGLIHTLLVTIDNKKIYVPNSTLSKDKIINYSAESHRQVEIIFPVSYKCDIKKAKAIVEQTVKECPYVDLEKDIYVRVWNLGASSVDIIMRCWVKKEDFIETKCVLLEEVKAAFDREDISIPFNQLDVHIGEK